MSKKHILKSKCTKHGSETLFVLEMLKNCMPPRQKSHLQLKMYKRRCGEKHIFKWTCAKHARSEPLFVLETSKNCTPLWRETHFQVRKMYQARQPRSTFWSSDVKRLHAARRTCRSQNVKKLTGSEHFLKFRCRKIARRCGEKHIFKWKCPKHAAVARSTFSSEHDQDTVKNTLVLAHFWTLRCGKGVRQKR